MDLRAKITDAICDQVSTSDTIDAVMGVVEAEQKHARADALFWAARHLRDTPITCTALTGPYWYGQGWKEAADHLQDLAGWDPSDGEAERTWLAARVRELEEENQRLRADLERGTTFVFGKTMDAFVRVTREPYHDNGPKWFVRSIGPTERHDDVTAALSRARDIAKEDTTT